MAQNSLLNLTKRGASYMTRTAAVGTVEIKPEHGRFDELVTCIKRVAKGT